MVIPYVGPPKDGFTILGYVDEVFIISTNMLLDIYDMKNKKLIEFDR